jgi:hypothetical protein
MTHIVAASVGQRFAVTTKWRALLVLSVAELFAMALWFSAALTLSDTVPPRHLFAVSALAGVGFTVVLFGAAGLASGGASLLAGLVFGASLLVLVPFVLVWAFAIVADSAQFSAAVTELGEGSYVGSALTLQTALGFLLTTLSIQLVPQLVALVGWQWAFAPLAIDPALGTLAMLRLRRLPEARRLAGGRG